MNSITALWVFSAAWLEVCSLRDVLWLRHLEVANDQRMGHEMPDTYQRPHVKTTIPKTLDDQISAQIWPGLVETGNLKDNKQSRWIICRMAPNDTKANWNESPFSLCTFVPSCRAFSRLCWYLREMGNYLESYGKKESILNVRIWAWLQKILKRESFHKF